MLNAERSLVVTDALKGRSPSKGVKVLGEAVGVTNAGTWAFRLSKSLWMSLRDGTMRGLAVGLNPCEAALRP